MSFDHSSTSTSPGSTILVIDNSYPEIENVGVGMYPSLMGTFNISAPILTIGSTLGSESSSSSSVPFCTMYLENSWTLPYMRTSDEDPIPTKMEMSLSVVEITYQATLDSIIDTNSSSLQTEEEDTFALHAWVFVSSCSHDCFDDVFPSDEAIL